MLLVSQTMAALDAARAARAAIPNPPNTPGVESLVASFISKVDACQSSVDRLTSMVEAELAAALADTTSALAVCRLQVGSPAQPLCRLVCTRVFADMWCWAVQTCSQTRTYN